MELNYTLIVALTIVCLFTYSFEIVFGLAGTIIMLFIMSYFIDTKTLIIYSTLPQILVAVIGLSRSPRTVKLGFISQMLLFATFGSVIGMLLFYQLSTKLFETLLATAIVVFGGYLVLANHAFRLNKPIRYSLDFFAGLSQQLFGISGPIAMTRLMGSTQGKTVIRNYAFAFFLSLNIVRLGSYIIQSIANPDNAVLNQPILMAMLISAPLLVIVLWQAHHLHFKVNESLFKKVVSWIILLGGLQLLYKAVYN